MANEYKTWPVLGDFQPNIKEELIRRKNQTFGEGNKPRAVWARAVSNAVRVEVRKSGVTASGTITEVDELRRDLNIMVGGLLRPSGATRGGFEPVYPRVAKGRELLDRPMPGIESISVASKGEFGSLRKITINWTCPSIEDLDILMPYWLSPGISVMVEWGWGQIGQLPIGIDIDDEGKMAELYRSPAKIMKTIILRKKYAGNQDFFIGIITNFTWNMNEDGTFTCTTELTTFGETMLALNLNKDVKNRGIDFNKKKTTYGIREYVEKAFNKENLKNQMDMLGLEQEPWYLDKRSIIKAFTVETNFGISFVGGVTAPLITSTPEAKGDIYVTWEFIEKRIINDHGCPIVGDNKSFHAFEMDSSNTKVSNDVFLYSRSADILINNNKNNTMILFNEKPKGYNEKKFGYDPEYDGFLKNVYVKRSLVVDTFKNSETLEDALKTLINKIRYATFDLWDLKIQTDALGESRSKIIDQRYISESGLNEINTLKTNKTIFNFGGYSGKSILRGISFTSKMTNQVALTHFFGRNKAADYEKTVYSDDSDVGIKSIYGYTVDRILRNLKFKEENEPLIEEKPKKETTIKGSRLKNKVGVVEWEVAPTSEEWFYYENENDIKIIDQYLRRQTPKNITKNIPIYPLEISVTIDGISGILPGNVFTLDNLPKLFKDSGVFQVVEISHEISSDDWVTTLRAFFRPVGALEGGKEKIIEPKQIDTEPENYIVDKDYLNNELV